MLRSTVVVGVHGSSAVCLSRSYATQDNTLALITSVTSAYDVSRPSTGSCAYAFSRVSTPDSFGCMFGSTTAYPCHKYNGDPASNVFSLFEGKPSYSTSPLGITADNRLSIWNNTLQKSDLPITQFSRLASISKLEDLANGTVYIITG